jgi:anaerobic selenocysteine-containing dehydrogenase
MAGGQPAGNTSRRIHDPWGPRTPFGAGASWPARVDVELTAGVTEADVERWVPSACVLCSNGCGLDIAVAGGRMVGVRGRVDDRVNHGRLGPKGLHGWKANLSSDRLTRPLRRVDGRLEETDWDTALSIVADRMRSLLSERGPLSLGFYTTGQLFLEEYYALAVLARAGIGTPHLDGNTRLCTATAAAALKESFGSDGQPGSYQDFDLCDTLFVVGHNIAATQTVLWARILDRLDGPDPPRLVVVDPRRTPVAARAEVHLAIRPGTNLALLNAIQRELIEDGSVDRGWVDAHTVGYDELAATVRPWTADRAAEVCGVPAEDIRRAVRVLGSAERLVSTCLQGIYQAPQATAAACQINNIHLLRGMIGRPGATVFQMNGQPTSQNTRECGADGDLPGFRNWQREADIEALAHLWDVDPLQIPHWSPPTHAMQIFRLAEQGSIRFLWILATNPAVSLPELRRIRSILEQERLFVVVSDAFPTETTALADVVLPAALWGEKTGVFTNTDRTVHLSERAVAPPGQARSDFDVLVDVAARLRLTTRSGAPLLPWRRPEEAFDAWRECSRGRPCDYSALTYDRLRDAGGIQWPCHDGAPDGTERLYTNGRFWSSTAECEDYGHDLATGTPRTEDEHRAHDPAGRAILRAAEPEPPIEPPDDEHPFLLTTGRRLHQFHTRTKTGRVPALDAAAPEPWLEICAGDADRCGLADGGRVRVVSARGHVDVTVRIAEIQEGVVFLPFHYGALDPGHENDRTGLGPSTAANELTITAWDPVSKQPQLKAAAVRLEPPPPEDAR